MSYTPGPWSPSTSTNNLYKYEIIAFSKRGLPKVIARLGSFFGSERAANARLISAAPELLEALLLILPDAEANHVGGPDTSARLDSARAAIAKATRP